MPIRGALDIRIAANCEWQSNVEFAWSVWRLPSLDFLLWHTVEPSADAGVEGGSREHGALACGE